jgi:hypothetical protein
MDPITWTDARTLTLAKWRDIQTALAEPDPLELITEINAVCSLCERAKAEAKLHGAWWPCRYCAAFEQFGGCADLQGRLTEAIVRSDWQRASALVAEAIADLEALELPPQV